MTKDGKPELLDVKDLNITFHMNDIRTEICSQVSFSIRQNERVGLIGESGCGKTIVALSLLRLLPDNAAISGHIDFHGLNLSTCSDEEIQKVRGSEISMIFEQPKTCLNPVFSIGWQIRESVKKTSGLPDIDTRQKAKELLVSVGMDPARYHQYPHQMSGGMQQRVMIAMAMASNPQLLIADEPTTALDLIHQAQILDLIKKKLSDSGASLFIITHDLDVAAELCDRIMVMYAGEIVEIRDIQDFINGPSHPYSIALVNAVHDQEFNPIPGVVPEFGNFPQGCRFHPRCRVSSEICSFKTPQLRESGSGLVRCHFA
ncbi:MAG TPA: ABC transporter ATP-binding protein [Methanospirillum sp.]|nr:ABC transporter ATP-binding protein [Methanospirillum sp.]